MIYVKKIALLCLVNFAALYTAAAIFPSIIVDGVTSVFWAGVILTLVNFIVRPLVIVLTFPVNLLTLGLFTLVINAWMVLLADWIIKGVRIPGFWVAFGAALIVSAFNLIVQGFLEKKKDRD